MPADLLRIANNAQDASDQLGLGRDYDAWRALDALTCLGARMLASVAVTAATTPDHVRRRAKADGRLRSDARVASSLGISLERDQPLHRRQLRDLALGEAAQRDVPGWTPRRLEIPHRQPAIEGREAWPIGHVLASADAPPDDPAQGLETSMAQDLDDVPDIPDIFDLLTSAAASYLASAQLSLKRCHSQLRDAVSAENVRRASLRLSPLACPSRATLARAIKRLNAHESRRAS